MSENMSIMWNVRAKIMEHINRKLVIVLSLAFVFLYIASVIPAKIAYADQMNSRERVYKTIEIKSGDSLWSIAHENYTDECKSMSDYIELIKKCNSLYEDEIHAGCYLVIPYYK